MIPRNADIFLLMPGADRRAVDARIDDIEDEINAITGTDDFELTIYTRPPRRRARSSWAVVYSADGHAIPGHSDDLTAIVKAAFPDAVWE